MREKRNEKERSYIYRKRVFFPYLLCCFTLQKKEKRFEGEKYWSIFHDRMKLTRCSCREESFSLDWCQIKISFLYFFFFLVVFEPFFSIFALPLISAGRDNKKMGILHKILFCCLFFFSPSDSLDTLRNLSKLGYNRCKNFDIHGRRESLRKFWFSPSPLQMKEI